MTASELSPSESQSHSHSTNGVEPTANPHPHHPHGDHEHAAVHPHVHSEESLRRIVNRLSRVEGHIRGIKMMVQESRPCPDVLIQLAAVRGAIDRVSRMILDEHLSECVARAAKEGKIEEEIEELKAALDRFLP
ncbi:metal-sensing transcriptional repressor [Egbenema bharatensis]|uniref:metal-sensing transcriptional repressor n=1 Tax=Egbenema bharatensis TaxID=3463334 RepID=UPI003A83B691